MRPTASTFGFALVPHFLCGVFAFGVVCLAGLNPPDAAPKVKATMSIVSSVDSIEPDKSFEVAVRFEIVDGWHMYWKNPGDSGMPPILKWDLPEGFVASEPRFPVPTIYKHTGGTDYIHERELVLLVTISPGKNVGPVSQMGVKGDWLVCDIERCLPESGETKLSLKRCEVGRSAGMTDQAKFAAWRAAVPASDEEAMQKAQAKRN